MYKCIYVYMYICMYICMYSCIRIDYVYTCMYICMQLETSTVGAPHFLRGASLEGLCPRYHG